MYLFLKVVGLFSSMYKFVSTEFFSNSLCIHLPGSSEPISEMNSHLEPSLVMCEATIAAPPR